jgi:FkbM family methyltransferase
MPCSIRGRCDRDEPHGDDDVQRRKQWARFSGVVGLMLEMVKALSRPLRHRVAVLRGKDLHISRSVEVPVEFHGTEYGGFAVLRDSLGPSSVVWSCGIGEDASFDTSLIAKYGCTVHAFDPTPRSIAWARTNVTDSRFQFHPWAISDSDGMLRLYLPRETSWVSASLVAGDHTRDEHIDVPTRRLAALRHEFGVPDLLKMDIEGAEYDVLRDLLTGKDRFLPKQIAVEFHHFWPAFGLAKTRTALSLLDSAGYRIAWVSPAHHELLLVHTT